MIKIDQIKTVFSQSHIPINKPNIFQRPQVGDIVTFWTTHKAGIIINEFDGPNDDKGRVFEVATFDGHIVSAMPFENEVTVIWQRRDNWASSMECESIAKQQAQTAFVQIDQIEFDF